MTITKLTFFSFTVAMLWAAPAHAYIDPGTGSILIQGIIAAIAAVGVTLKLYWHRFVGLFRRKPARPAEQEPATSEDTDAA